MTVTPRQESLVAAEAELSRLVAERSGYERDRAASEALGRQLRGIERELAELDGELAGLLGPDGAAPGSSGLARPGDEELAAAEALAGAHRRALALAEARAEEAARAGEKERRAAEELDLARREGPSEPGEALSARGARLGELRRWVTERDRLRAALAEAAREERLAELASRKGTGPGLRRPGALAALLAACALLLGASAVFGLRAGEVPGGVLALGGTALLLALAGALLASARADEPAPAPEPGTSSPAGDPAAELARALEEIGRLATWLELRQPVHLIDLEAASDRLAAELERRRLLDGLEAGWASATAERVGAQGRAGEAAAALDRLLAEADLLGRRFGAGPRFPAERLPQLLTTVRTAGEREEARVRVRRELERLEGSIGAFDLALATLLGALGGPPATGIPAGAGAGSSHALLLALEQEAAAAAALLRRRLALEEVVATATEDLAAALGSGEQSRRLREECATGALLAWREERATLLAELDAAEERRDLVLAERVAAEARLAELRSSDEIAALALEREGVAAARRGHLAGVGDPRAREHPPRGDARPPRAGAPAGRRAPGGRALLRGHRRPLRPARRPRGG